MSEHVSGKNVLIFGAGGRVGLQLAETLLQNGVSVVGVDVLPQDNLTARLSRVLIDAELSGMTGLGSFSAHGDVSVLDQEVIANIIQTESPDIVVNYAIPFTWDATKSLPNYKEISAAGLGAFAPIQALAPLNIGRAMAAVKSKATFVVGNLPDITIPVLYGCSHSFDMALPVAGAGNVGLIATAIKHYLASTTGYNGDDLDIYLVCHHVHWVAPREPGYPNDKPFKLTICHQGSDITAEFGDSRLLMNTAINYCYEDGAGFSSTTGILAARLVMALLDDTGQSHYMHVPAPNGLDGGYPVCVKNGEIFLNLPTGWNEDDLSDGMKQATQGDGIESISADGHITFQQATLDILKAEMGIDLPRVVTPETLEEVAQMQIRIAQSL